MCEGYVSAPGPEKKADFFRSYEAAVATRATRYPDARKALDAVGDRMMPEALHSVGLMPQYAVSMVYTMTGPDADALVIAEQKEEMHQLGEAIAAYQAAADKVSNDKTPNGRAAHFIKAWLQQLKWEKQFATGEWVDAQPTDAELTRWESIAGTWTIDKEGTLTGKGDASGLLLTFTGTYLSPRFEIDGEMDLPPPNKGGTVYFGMSLANAQPTKFTGWWLARHPDKVDCYNNWASKFHREIPIQEHNTVNMTQWDDKLIGRLNGHMTTNMAQMDTLMGPQMYLGLGAPGAAAGTEVHLKKLRVRKLGDEPKP